MSPQFTVSAQEGMLVIDGAGYRVAADIADAVDFADDLAGAVINVAEESLRIIQSYICRATGNPWPATTSPPTHAQARIQGKQLEMWFTDADGTLVLKVPTVQV